MITQEEYQSRRTRLIDAIGENGIALVAAAPVAFRNGETEFSYRQNSDFWYLTGFNEPHAVLVLVPGRPEGEVILFNQSRDPAQEVWTGFRAGQEGAVDTYGVDQAFSIDDFVEQLPLLLNDRQQVFYPIASDRFLDNAIKDCVLTLEAQVRAGVATPPSFVDLGSVLHDMRLIKSEAEVDLMRKAAEISAQAHINAIKKCRPGMYEYQLEAQLLHDFYEAGCRSVAYPSIVGAGNRSCILHYNDNTGRIEDGDMVLIDAGGEYQNYAADITRTFPANGHFSAEQKAIYELVLKTQIAVIEAVKPGTSRDDLRVIAERTMTEGLVELELLSGDIDRLIQDKAFFPFYMHKVGHWLGLDVHDVGAYKVDSQWRTLASGMVLTVEPGIYIAEGSAHVDPKWWKIGVRIEDDVLVTDSGHEVLSKDVPKTVDEIESLMTSL